MHWKVVEINVPGVSALNLCLSNCSWSGDAAVELFPWDAGTDDGTSYMASTHLYFVMFSIDHQCHHIHHLHHQGLPLLLCHIQHHQCHHNNRLHHQGSPLLLCHIQHPQCHHNHHLHHQGSIPLSQWCIFYPISIKKFNFSPISAKFINTLPYFLSINVFVASPVLTMMHLHTLHVHHHHGCIWGNGKATSETVELLLIVSLQSSRATHRLRYNVSQTLIQPIHPRRSLDRSPWSQWHSSNLDESTQSQRSTSSVLQVTMTLNHTRKHRPSSLQLALMMTNRAKVGGQGQLVNVSWSGSAGQGQLVKVSIARQLLVLGLRSMTD